jgi:hypothetical protein
MILCMRVHDILSKLKPVLKNQPDFIKKTKNGKE